MRHLPFKLLVAMAIASSVWVTAHIAGCGRVRPVDVTKAVEVVRAVCDIAETVGDCTRKIEGDAGTAGARGTNNESQ